MLKTYISCKVGLQSHIFGGLMAKKRRYYKGKKASKGEIKVAKFLDVNNIKYTREQTFAGCLGMKLGQLRFDFFLEDYNMCIEVQGHHHYQPINNGRRAKIVHHTTLIHDRIKREYMTKYTTVILEIPYWEYKNTEDIIKDVLQLSIIKVLNDKKDS